MPNKKNGQVKMSLGDFMGGQPATGMAALPTRPKERGPDDDGSFKRRSDYNDSRKDQEPSRSEGDNNWRRGGGGSIGGSLRVGGGYDDRRGGGGYNRRGGGGNERSSNDRDVGGFDRRGGYNDDRNGSDNFDRRGTGRGGYDNFNDRGGAGFDSFRRSGYDRGTANGDSQIMSSSQVGGLSGIRPRLQLKTRTMPQSEALLSVGKKKNATVDEKSLEVKVVVEVNKVGSEDSSSLMTDEKSFVGTTKPSHELVGWEKVEGARSKALKENPISKVEGIDGNDNDERKISKKREPDVVNSRAAMLESAPDLKKDSNNGNVGRKEHERVRRPPPVVNRRFEQLADEEREKHKDRESRRGPPLVANSRFAAAAEADKDVWSHKEDFKNIPDKPTITNSRFAAAVEADRSYINNRGDLYDNRDRGPPPVANSRFAAAVEADRDRNYNSDDFDRGPPPVANSRFAAAAEADRDRNYNRDDFDRGPPPVANSRFAAAAEADRDWNYNSEKCSDSANVRDRGPPPVANSRFAAAAEADKDYSRGRVDYDSGLANIGPPLQASSRFAVVAEADKDRSYKRDGNSGILDDRGRGPPPVANSRFAAAVEADRDYTRDRDDYNNGRGDRRSNRGYDDENRRGYDGGRGNRFMESPGYQYQETQPPKSSVADLLKPKARPMAENILKVPTKEQSSNFLAQPSKECDGNILRPPSKAKPVVEPKSSKKLSDATPHEVDHSAFLAEFVSGKRLGNDLKTWLEVQANIPSVENLVFRLLTNNVKTSPDLECAWAEPGNFGAGLLFLVEDDLLKQMEVLFAIQKYCDVIGMPKLDDEYVVQAMFRSMYKYDLADDEAFSLWKEDECPEHETGKLKAVIQTVDWFNWLEEDEDDEDYEE